MSSVNPAKTPQDLQVEENREEETLC